MIVLESVLPWFPVDGCLMGGVSSSCFFTGTNLWVSKKMQKFVHIKCNFTHSLIVLSMNIIMLTGENLIPVKYPKLQKKCTCEK